MHIFECSFLYQELYSSGITIRSRQGPPFSQGNHIFCKFHQLSGVEKTERGCYCKQKLKNTGMSRAARWQSSNASKRNRGCKRLSIWHRSLPSEPKALKTGSRTTLRGCMWDWIGGWVPSREQKGGMKARSGSLPLRERRSANMGGTDSPSVGGGTYSAWTRQRLRDSVSSLSSFAKDFVCPLHESNEGGRRGEAGMFIG
jgi:hypothetical protein